jgi:hypothetical protein
VECSSPGQIALGRRLVSEVETVLTLSMMPRVKMGVLTHSLPISLRLVTGNAHLQVLLLLLLLLLEGPVVTETHALRE